MQTLSEKPLANPLTGPATSDPTLPPTGIDGKGGGAPTTGKLPPTPIPPPVPPGSVIEAPAIPQPTAPGDIVGLVLQNNEPTALPAREITFGQEFADGQMRPGQGLVALIDGTAVPVQMDVKTTNPDGSVAMAILTLEQPTLAANTSDNVMLQLAPATRAPDVNIAALTSDGYNFSVDLTLHNANGTTTPLDINAAHALAAALQSGSVSYWLQGPQATQVRVDVPVSGSLHVTFDITAYADGTTSTDVQFNNDLAMTPVGGTVNYDVNILQNGTQVFAQSNITQFQYQDWDQQFWSNGAPQVNVQHDVLAMEEAGFIQAYDLTTGVAAAVIRNEATQMAGPGFGILGNAGITEDMPETGARNDIGTTTVANAAWLITQNQTAAEYALAQANAAGSIPWHFFDAQTETYLNVTDYPRLWPDPRAVRNGLMDLTQPLPSTAAAIKAEGWSPDPAHEPDLDYVAYLMTGNRYYLDQLNAEADYDIFLTLPPGARHYGEGLVVGPTVTVRAEGWSLREIVEAAAANPDGSAEKAYFTQIMNNNFNFLLSETASANTDPGGWIPASGSNVIISPWQQDYFATTVVLAAEQGVAGAKQLLEWETNFLAGRFLAAAQGFDPHFGVAYRMAVGDAATGTPYQTWAQIEQATMADPEVAATAWNGTTWGGNHGYYDSLALASLAGDITVTASPDAIHAYGLVLSFSDSQAGLVWQQDSPQFDIAPRLPDGQYLTQGNIIVSDDTIAANLHCSDADQLIYETGSGNVTITGGTGINLLFAGSGQDTLIGGPNSDYLFGGSGPDTFSAGAGNNYMEAGSGVATFLLAATTAANDIIADFKVGVDKLVVADAAGNPATAAEITNWMAGATTDASGDAVMHLTASHDVVLQGIAVSGLNAAMFAHG